jgi:hypothetical protein
MEAMLFTGGFSFDEMLVKWGNRFAKVAKYNSGSNTIEINTLNRVATALPFKHLIIKKKCGNFAISEKSLFKKIYDKID